MKGVDISGWQAGFNVAAADADFVFIKATGGGSFTSSEFARQADSAEASGKPHGFYHYASEKGCAADPITEADHFLQTIAGHVGPSTGIALDWEETNLGNTGWVQQWLDHVSAALGRPPSTIFLYMSQATVNAYDWSAVYGAGYRLWCAQYPTMAVQGYGPVTGPPAVNWGGQGLTMWQYSSAGRINGWGGNLDLNVLYTDWDTIHGVTGQASTITPIPEDDMFTDADRGALTELFNALPRINQILEAVDVRTGDKTHGNLAAAADLIQTRINTAVRHDGTPYKIACQGDVDAVLSQVPAAVWNQNIGAGNAAGVLNHVASQPVTPAAVAAVDVDALATKLAAVLPPAVVAQLATQLAKL